MKSISRSFAIAAALGTFVAGPATASASDDTAVAKLVTKLTYLMDQQPFGDPKWTSTSDDMGKRDLPETCFETIRAAGLEPDHKVFSEGAIRFKNHQKEGDKRFILGSDVEGMCKRYEAMYVHEYVETALMGAYLAKDAMKRPVEGFYEGEALAVGKVGELCAKKVDAALAYGLPATEKIESTRYGMPAIELGAARAALCQPAIDFAAKRIVEIKQLAGGKHQAIVDVYKKAGIKGKRLELFVSYGMPDNTGFYAAGCETSVESLPALKKAKKLFVWLEGNDGYTIRKFTFKGDNYTETEHDYSTKEAAYRGCR